MTPDGSDFGHVHPAPPRTLPVSRAIVLHGGRALVLIEGAETAPPPVGRMLRDGAVSRWTALTWRIEADGRTHWHGVAVVDRVPTTEDRVMAGGDAWSLPAAPALDIAPEPLADLVRRAGASGRDVFGFLVSNLLAGQGDSPETRACRSFARAFVSAVAEPDGFVEVVAAPTTGGLFAQGWSMSLAAGATILADADGSNARSEVEVAIFEREDILPPGKGFCCFGKHWGPTSLDTVDALFFERDGRLLRLDILRGSAIVTGDHATAHVAHMLPRLEAPAETLAAFRRICRPRYGGVDTLSGTALPIAAAFDAVLQAPDGTLLTMGWLLDPLGRVERALIKSTGNLYGHLDADWCPLPRPDLNRAFDADPRFATLLGARDVMHGFIARAPAKRAQVDGAEVYLELVLDDGTCLFRPVTVTPFDCAERLPQILGTLSPTEPELARIVADHLAPFLASVPAASRRTGRGGTGRPIPLGSGPAGQATVAVMPFRRPAELQTVLALMARAPEAAMLDLVLVASREVAAAGVEKLDDAFAFYGVAGSLVVSAGQDSLAGQLDLGVAASESERVLCWLPSALPKAPGWLERLEEEAAGIDRLGLISPTLIHEDGSIYFGGAAPDGAGPCALAGYGTARLIRGAPRPVTTGAAEIALIDRAALADAGGFAGRLFGDTLAHVDLAHRLGAVGRGSWCSGTVEFWILDDHPAGAPTDPVERLVRQIDAALLGRSSARRTPEAGRPNGDATP